MNQSITKTPQAQVRAFVETHIRTAEDFKKPLKLHDFGIEETMTFETIRAQFVRGLTLKIQASERPSSTKKLNERIEFLELQLREKMAQKS